MDENFLWSWFMQSCCSCCRKEAKEIKSWADHRLVEFLLHSFRPDLVSKQEIDFVAAKQDDLGKSYKLLETHYGIPILLHDSEIMCKNVDIDKPEICDLPFLTYLCHFYDSFHKLRPACENVKIESPTNFSIPPVKILENYLIICNYCNKDVHIFERFIVDSELRHRSCFNCTRCQKLLHIGLYRRSKNSLTSKNDEKNKEKDENLQEKVENNKKSHAYECLEHEKEDFLTKISLKIDSGSAKVENFEEKNVNLNPEIDQNVDVSSKSQEMVLETHGSDAEDSKPAEKQADLEPEKVEPLEKSPEIQNSEADEQAKTENQEKLAVIKPKPPPRMKKKKVDVQEIEKSSATDHIDVYPEELNPFDDEEEENKKKLTENEQKLTKMVQKSDQETPKITKTGTASSLNPFDSDLDDDADSACSESSSLSSWNICNESDCTAENFELASKRNTMSSENMTVPRSQSSLEPDLRRPFEQQRLSLSPYSTFPKKRQAPEPPSPLVTGQPTSSSSTPKIVHGLKTKPPSKQRKKRPAPPPPLPSRRLIKHDVTLNAAELLTHMNSIDDEFSSLEEKGCEMERKLRASKVDSDGMERKHLLLEWIDMCQKHFRLIQTQNEYAFLLRERQLDDLHTEVEYQLRCIIEKPESLKEAGDEQKEAYLLQKLLQIIEEKSRLAESSIAETASSVRGIDLTEADDIKEGANKHGSTGKTVKNKKHLKQRLKSLKKKLILKK